MFRTYFSSQKVDIRLLAIYWLGWSLHSKIITINIPLMGLASDMDDHRLNWLMTDPILLLLKKNTS